MTTPRSLLTYVWNNRPAANPNGSRPTLSEAAKELGETEDRLRSAVKSAALWKVVRIAATGDHLELVTKHTALDGLLAEADGYGVNLDGPLPVEMK